MDIRLTTTLVSALLLGNAVAGETTLYRLDETTSLQSLCVAPCRCPASQPVALRGTFELGPAIPGNVFDFHEVSSLYFTMSGPDGPTGFVTGEGTYKITNYAPKKQQEMELALSIDDNATRHFFSDAIAMTGNDGRIELRLSVNGFYCRDTVLTLTATPVMPGDVVPYVLDDGSTYRQGCFDPCDCILEDERPMFGTFGLLELHDAGTYAEYALLDVNFIAPQVVPGFPDVIAYGAGRYAVIQGFAGPAHTMVMRAWTNGVGPLQFDQELENAATKLPNIDITIDTTDRVCYDQVMHISASPLVRAFTRPDSCAIR